MHIARQGRRAVPLFLLLVFPLLFSWGCTEETTNILPTEPRTPPAAPAVTTSATCTFDTCTASFSTNTTGLKRYSWTFPGGNPSSAVNDPAPSTTYSGVTVRPTTKPFTLTVCNTTASEDPLAEGCLTVSGNVTLP